MTKLRVVHVVGTISLNASGPSQSVPALVRGLADEGVDVELHYLDYGGRPDVPSVKTVVHARTRIPGLRFAAWNADLLYDLWRRARPGTIFHAHGLWHFPTIYPAWVGSVRGTPWVCSPRGTLSAWSLGRSRRIKAMSLALGQRHALERAAFVHATSQAEADEVRAFGVDRPVVVVPNATVGPGWDGPARRARKDLLFLARVHPIKGLDRLIDAWALVADSFPEARLLVAGPSEGGYQESIAAIVASRRIPRVVFLGPLAGAAKWQALAQARALVLPSHSENFGMVVAEALTVGTPAIASRGTPWSSLVTDRAGWWIDNAVPTLASALRDCLSESLEDLEERGERGRNLVVRTCSPRSVARAMIPAYERAIADAPAFRRVG